MKKAIFTLLICFFAGLLLSSFMDDEQRGRRTQDNRVAVERILEAYNLKFNKDIGQTTIVFQLVPGDSIKIECGDCPLLMGEGDKGTMSMTLQSIDGVSTLTPASFDRWLKIKSANGKVGIVFQRDGLGEKNLLVSSLRVWRKTRKPQRDEAGVPVSLLDVNNLYIDKLSKDLTEEQTTFFFKMKSEDKIIATIKGANGAAQENLICQQYKEGEEFDKSPIEVGPPFDVPKVDGGADRFAFEFSHIKNVKGVNTYHIDLERIPARSVNFLEIEDINLDSDTVVARVDTLVPPVPEDPFLKYLKQLQGAPQFQCKTPELDMNMSLFGRLNLGPGKQSKVCMDLPLTDECVAADECIGCDTIWAFWIGAGSDMINRFHFADSTRKLRNDGVGIMEAYAHSRLYRGMQGNGSFPAGGTGENIFFTIIDSYRKEEFLSRPFFAGDWYGDGYYTFSPERFVTSSQYILRFNPGRPVSLCMCNDNSLSSVPVLFRFQQFLTEPVPVDSSQFLTEDPYLYDEVSDTY